MNTEKRTIMFATQLPHHAGGSYYSCFSTRESVAKAFHNRPLTKLLVREVRKGETGDYFAWWSNKSQEFMFVFHSRTLVSACFTYGAAAEERAGQGKVMCVVVEVHT